MKRKNTRQRPWKETRVTLAKATALVFDGPGTEWLLVVRGDRTQSRPTVRQSAKGRRS